MPRQPLTTAQSLAAAATVASLLIVTAVPALQGRTDFDPSVALAWMEIVALLWATAFGADNLIELRRTRVAEFEPLLDIVAEERLHQGELRLRVAIHNLGKGTAAGLTVRAWWADVDGVEFFPHPVSTFPEHLGPGERKEALVELPTTRFLFQKEVPVHFALEVAYRDALGHSSHRQLSYRIDHSAAPSRLRRVDQPFSRNEGAKLRMLQTELAALSRELQLERAGLALSGYVGHGAMSITLERPQGNFVTQSGADRPVHEMIERIRERVEVELSGPSHENAADSPS